LLIRFSGSGKSSLIRAIIQQCDDIVHVDVAQEMATVDNFESLAESARSPTSPASRHKSQSPIQLRASTKAYPSWFLELEESSASKRRPSAVESILDRNISFVEFPSYGSGESDTKFVPSLVETMFMHADVGSVESEQAVMEILGGSGGHLIDAVLYIFADSMCALPAGIDTNKAVDDLSDDLAQFSQLATLTNVIPIIGKSDLCNDDKLQTFKHAILKGIQDLSITPFLFGKTVDDVLQSLQDRPNSGIPTPDFEQSNSEETISAFPTARIPPYTVSALPGPDLLEMDASLLMSSSYMPPLVTSELPDLISQVLDPEHMPWLRRAACRKYLAWRKRMRFTNHLGSSGSKSHSADNLAWTARSLSHPARAAWLLEQINQEVVRGNIGVLPTAEHPATSGAPVQHPASSIRASKSQLPDQRRVPGRPGGRRATDLPAWARKGEQVDSREYDPKDPLRLYEIWDGWGRAAVWSAGGSIIIGVVWVVAMQGWTLHHRGP
jgi:hypothetical protein